MRLIKIYAPAGSGKVLTDLALKFGADKVVVGSGVSHQNRSDTINNDIVEISTSTPSAKKIIEELMTAPYYSPETYSFHVVHPLSLFGSKPTEEEIHPIVLPTTNVYQDLFQFSKITYSLVLRVFLSALLLCYGMVEYHLPIMVAGLLFLPFHH